MQFDATTINILVEGIWEMIYMVFLSSVLSYVIDVPLEIALVMTDREGISLVPLLNKVLDLIINLLRSVPFIILLIMVLPITKFIVGRTVGSNVTMVLLTTAAVPYIGRMVESSLKEVGADVIEVVKFMGVSTWQIIVKVLLPEARPSSLTGVIIFATTILGYSVMAGSTGGGGLGDTAIRCRYHRYQTNTTMVVMVLLAVIAQLIQKVAMRMSRESDKRIWQKDSGTQSRKRVQRQSPENPVIESRKRVPWYRVVCESVEAARSPNKERIMYTTCV